MRVCRVLFASSVISREAVSAQTFRVLQAFKDMNGHLNVPRSFKGDNGGLSLTEDLADFKIGELVDSLRAKARKRTLSPVDVAKLEKMGFIFNPSAYRMQCVSMAFQLYVERYGNGRVLRRFSIDKDDVTWPQKCRGINLGGVLAKIRRGAYPKLVPDLIAMGVVVGQLNTPPDFDLNFKALKVYKELNNSLDINREFVIPSDDIRYPAETRGLKLGMWVNNLRKKGYYQEHRQTLLDFGLDLVYRPTRKANYRLYYDATVAYKQIHGNVEVSTDFVVPLNDERYPEKSRGTKLGAFLNDLQLGSYSDHREMFVKLGVIMKLGCSKKREEA